MAVTMARLNRIENKLRFGDDKRSLLKYFQPVLGKYEDEIAEEHQELFEELHSNDRRFLFPKKWDTVIKEMHKNI